MTDIYVNLAVEDDLSEAVFRKALTGSGKPYQVCNCYKGRGFGYLKRNIRGFNNASQGTPFFILTDLDAWECPAELIQDWLPLHQHHPSFLFRIAVREVESWIMADRHSFAAYLGVRAQHVPANPEVLPDPKLTLISLARRCRYRNIRTAIVPLGDARIGPDYNATLTNFVLHDWNPVRAAKHAPSLDRALNRLRAYA